MRTHAPHKYREKEQHPQPGAQVSVAEPLTASNADTLGQTIPSGVPAIADEVIKYRHYYQVWAINRRRPQSAKTMRKRSAVFLAPSFCNKLER
jgi:hypothetical protein